MGSAPRLLAACIALVCTIALTSAGHAARPRIGERAPVFSRRDIEDRWVDLKSWQSEKRPPVVLMTFFASWCGACKREAPSLVAMARRYGPQGLRIVAIGVAMSSESTEAYARDYLGASGKPARAPPGIYILRDRSRYIAGDLYGLVVDGKAELPETLLIDRNGRIHLALRGARAQGLADLETRLRVLLGPAKFKTRN